MKRARLTNYHRSFGTQYSTTLSLSSFPPTLFLSLFSSRRFFFSLFCSIRYWVGLHGESTSQRSHPEASANCDLITYISSGFNDVSLVVPVAVIFLYLDMFFFFQPPSLTTSALFYNDTANRVIVFSAQQLKSFIGPIRAMKVVFVVEAFLRADRLLSFFFWIKGSCLFSQYCISNTAIQW